MINVYKMLALRFRAQLPFLFSCCPDGTWLIVSLLVCFCWFFTSVADFELLRHIGKYVTYIEWNSSVRKQGSVLNWSSIRETEGAGGWVTSWTLFSICSRGAVFHWTYTPSPRLPTDSHVMDQYCVALLQSMLKKKRDARLFWFLALAALETST